MTSYSNFSTQIEESINDKFDHEIYDWNIIRKSITILVNKNFDDAGGNIVDFIDLDNWDFISNFSFDDSTRGLELEWYPNDKFHIYIESAVSAEFNNTIYAFLKGYYYNQLSLNRIYNTKCSSCSFENSGSYVVDVYRTVKKVNEKIQTSSTNYYTTCILVRPKNGHVASTGLSRDLMDMINISLAEREMTSLHNEVTSIEEYDHNSLQKKGNTARRHLEYILMPVNICIMHLNSVQYQEQMLGSLVSVIEALDYKPLMESDTEITENILNACNHHGGIGTERKDVIFSLEVIENSIKAMKKTNINKSQLGGTFKSTQK